jgi:hypothetical protein
MVAAVLVGLSFLSSQGSAQTQFESIEELHKHAVGVVKRDPHMQVLWDSELKKIASSQLNGVSLKPIELTVRRMQDSPGYSELGNPLDSYKRVRMRLNSVAFAFAVMRFEAEQLSMQPSRESVRLFTQEYLRALTGDAEDSYDLREDQMEEHPGRRTHRQVLSTWLKTELQYVPDHEKASLRSFVLQDLGSHVAHLSQAIAKNDFRRHTLRGGLFTAAIVSPVLLALSAIQGNVGFGPEPAFFSIALVGALAATEGNFIKKYWVEFKRLREQKNPEKIAKFEKKLYAELLSEIELGSCNVIFDSQNQ